MIKDVWHILRDEGANGAPGGVTVSRVVPVRWDLSAEAHLGAPAHLQPRRLRLAQQVRQDLWRTLRRVRGLAPAVRVTAGPGWARVRAGGRVEGRFDRAHAMALLEGMLADPASRRRWVASALPRHPHAPAGQDPDRRIGTVAR